MLEEWFEQLIKQIEKNSKYTREDKIIEFKQFPNKIQTQLKFKWIKQAYESSVVWSELLSHLIHDSPVCQIVWATLWHA